jgi:hypothetical protein
VGVEARSLTAHIAVPPCFAQDGAVSCAKQGGTAICAVSERASTPTYPGRRVDSPRYQAIVRLVYQRDGLGETYDRSLGTELHETRSKDKEGPNPSDIG